MIGVWVFMGDKPFSRYHQVISKLSFYILLYAFQKSRKHVALDINPTQCCPCNYILLIEYVNWHSYLCRCVCTSFHSLPRFFSLSSNVQPAG